MVSGFGNSAWRCTPPKGLEAAPRSCGDVAIGVAPAVCNRPQTTKAGERDADVQVDQRLFRSSTRFTNSHLCGRSAHTPDAGAPCSIGRHRIWRRPLWEIAEGKRCNLLAQLNRRNQDQSLQNCTNEVIIRVSCAFGLKHQMYVCDQSHHRVLCFHVLRHPSHSCRCLCQ